MKRLVFLLILILSLLLICACTDGGTQDGANIALPEENSLLTTILQSPEPADAILLHSADGAVLIDAGTPAMGKTLVAHLKAAGISKLDAMIITHFDQDHVGGAAAVIQNFAVDTVLVPDYAKSSSEYNAFIAALQQASVTQTKVGSGDYSFSLGEASFVVNASHKTFEDGEDNNYSLITTVSYGNTKLLFLGDAENARLKEYLQVNPGHMDFVKLPHHGRYHKPLKNLLEMTTPAFSCATTGKREPIEEKTQALLDSCRVTNLCTDMSNVFISTDGTTVRAWQ